MQTIIKKMVSTRSGLGVTLLRLVIGGIFFKAGAGKLFGWFGGIGILGVTDFFQGIGIPFPEFNAYLVGLTEFLGGIALLLGLFTRLAAFPFIITMIVAIFTAHRDGDFYYPLVLITGCLALLETGGGVFSLDRWLESNPFTHPFRMRNWNIFSLNSGSSEGAFRKEPAAFMRR